MRGQEDHRGCGEKLDVCEVGIAREEGRGAKFGN